MIKLIVVLFMLLSASKSFAQEEEKALVDSAAAIVNPKSVSVKIDPEAADMSDRFVAAISEPDIFMVQYKGSKIPKGLILAYIRNWASIKLKEKKFSLLAVIDKNYFSIMFY